jgi:hypothetical protein
MTKAVVATQPAVNVRLGSVLLVGHPPPKADFKTAALNVWKRERC